MVNGWGGADPVEAADLDDYELGTQYRANADITLTHARVWTGAGEVNLTNRRARVWSLAGAQLGIATLPDDLATGWSTHAYDTPIEIASGGGFIASFSTGGNEGALPGALTSAVDSSDGNLTAVAAVNGTYGNGIYNLNHGSFPNTGSGNQSFYGADVAYTVGIGGNTAPVVTALTANAAGAVVTATVAYTDAETLVGATARFAWGDDTADTVVTYPTISAQHTYTTSDLYAVLVTVTDASGATDTAAEPVQVVVPSSEVLPLRAVEILNAVVTHALRLGYFDSVNQHDPGNPTGYGLSAAIWVTKLSPIRSSGLGISSARLALIVRISSNLSQKPGDAIDPNIIAAASALMGAYIGNFTLGGLIRHVDVHGAHGPGLDCDIGYRPVDENRYRTAVIALPLVINDLWEQVA
jgi:hypothetical protein